MNYEQKVFGEMIDWQRSMQRRPSLMSHVSRNLQTKLNSYIPEKVHKAVTGAIKQMIRGVLFGAHHLNRAPHPVTDFQQTETEVLRKIEAYKHTAAAEGSLTGAGGFLLGLAEFPILLGIKLKLLFEVATIYGYSVKDYRERLFLLQVFQLAFSSQQHRREVFGQIQDWDQRVHELPEDINQFNWRSFQQEYRDYIDLAKMAQLIPGIGAVVGFVVNYKLLNKLGVTAMNAYRMRYFETKKLEAQK
jgi:hypothetical protein